MNIFLYTYRRRFESFKNMSSKRVSKSISFCKYRLVSKAVRTSGDLDRKIMEGMVHAAEKVFKSWLIFLNRESHNRQTWSGILETEYTFLSGCQVRYQELVGVNPSIFCSWETKFLQASTLFCIGWEYFLLVFWRYWYQTFLHAPGRLKREWPNVNCFACQYISPSTTTKQ